MRRTKIKTDNVEQLMEIVRSLQRGEEPTQESIRKEAERVSETDAPLSDTSGHDTGSRTSKEKAGQIRTGRTDTEADWDAEDDAFVQSLEETDARIGARRERLADEEEQAGGRGLSGLWQKAAGYLESRRAQRESEDDDYEDTDEEAALSDGEEAPETEADQESKAEADDMEMPLDS